MLPTASADNRWQAVTYDRSSRQRPTDVAITQAQQSSGESTLPLTTIR